MRSWRKLYSKITYSPDLARISDSAGILLTLLIAAQDDEGYYPWDEVSVRRIIVTRPHWTTKNATDYAQELVDAGIAKWQDGGVLLVNGKAMNGIPRRDVEPEVYVRNRDVNTTSTPRQQDVALEQSRVDKIREDKIAAPSARCTTLQEWQSLVAGAENRGQKVAAIIEMLNTHWKKPLGKNPGGIISSFWQDTSDDAWIVACVWNAIEQAPTGNIIHFVKGRLSKKPNNHRAGGFDNSIEKYRRLAQSDI